MPRGADGCECIFGSFEDNEAGDCSAIVKAVRGFLMVSATLLPTLFVLIHLIALSCFPPPLLSFLLILLWRLVTLCPT